MCLHLGKGMEKLGIQTKTKFRSPFLRIATRPDFLHFARGRLWAICTWRATVPTEVPEAPSILSDRRDVGSPPSRLRVSLAYEGRGCPIRSRIACRANIVDAVAMLLLFPLRKNPRQERTGELLVASHAIRLFT